jgi:SUMO ligase MMS21 Smc5/6 complex component
LVLSYTRLVSEVLVAGKEFDKRCTNAFKNAFRSWLSSPASIMVG